MLLPERRFVEVVPVDMVRDLIPDVVRRKPGGRFRYGLVGRRIGGDGFRGRGVEEVEEIPEVIGYADRREAVSLPTLGVGDVAQQGGERQGELSLSPCASPLTPSYPSLPARRLPKYARGRARP